MEDDDLLQEIHLRLPPEPPHLLRASLVCKRWRRLATDPKFLRRFRIHHRRPPLLGFFSSDCGVISFRSPLDAPYRIPSERFSLRVDDHEDWRLLECRHGRVLLVNYKQRQLMVWDPITGDQRLVAVPPEFYIIRTGAVLCAAGDQGHVHGSCHSSPFKVVLLCINKNYDQAVDINIPIVSVYSSETGIWGDLVSTALPNMDILYCHHRSTLVGSALHWLLIISGSTPVILEFDLDRPRLTVVEMPPAVHPSDTVQIIHAKDGGVGLATLSSPHYQQPCLKLWERKVNCDGAVIWVLQKSVKLQEILGLEFQINMESPVILLYYAEDIHAMLLHVHPSIFMVHLESMQSRELFKRNVVRTYHPFTSFYTEGINNNLTHQ